LTIEVAASYGGGALDMSPTWQLSADGRFRGRRVEVPYSSGVENESRVLAGIAAGPIRCFAGDTERAKP
jgi:hypothetical protein